MPSPSAARRGEALLAAALLGCGQGIGGVEATAGPAAEERPLRARDLGLAFGGLPPGPLNAITDVPGVRVGHVTLVEGESVRTGVTAILPHGGNPFREKVPCAIEVANGFGKLVGVTQVRELGELESPILLTSTLSVFRVADGVVGWLLSLPGNEDVRSVNVVVGETNDGRLNDIRLRRAGPEEAVAAIEAAASGPVAEGAVGAGTGTVCFGYKGGIGTSSRLVQVAEGTFVLGALVQANFGGERLVVAGRPVPPPPGAPAAGQGDGNGSCMMVLATDAPLDARQLGRLARRGVLAMARVGSVSSHGTGGGGGESDGVVAAAPLPEGRLEAFYRAAVDALEEAIVNSLLAARPAAGGAGRAVPALTPELLGLPRAGGGMPDADRDGNG